VYVMQSSSEWNPVNRTYRHAGRYADIIQVLIRYGFADIVSRSRMEQVFTFGRKVFLRKTDPSIFSYTRWERMRMVVEHLGPTFIKIAQLLTLRADLIPIELIREFEKLQDTVPPFPAQEAKAVIAEELSAPADELFASFDDTPIAAGSLAQVHAARLSSGESVAVKVRRPGITEKIAVDIEIMRTLASLLEKHLPNAGAYNLREIVEEFSAAIRQELDFEHEALQLEQFRSLYGELDHLHVPALYHEYTTKQVLVTEFIRGIKISHIEELQGAGIDCRRVAEQGADAVLTQIFEKGFFHADPHPGNIMVLPGGKICFLDYGMMGTISPATRRLLTAIIIGALFQDTEYIVRNLLRICRTRGKVNQRNLEARVAKIADEFFFKPLEKIDVKRLIQDMLRLFPENSLVLPADLYLLTRALLLLQGNGERLDPEFNFAEYVRPFIRKVFRRKVNLSKLTKDFILTVEELAELGRTLPFDIRDILQNLKEGKIRIEFEHHGLSSAEKTLSSTVNRLSFAVVAASVLIGSSLVLFSGMPPLWRGIPVIGLIGIVGAGLLCFWLLISIIRHGRM
jgi:ubiquinone biosynthesis protein